MYEMKNSLYNIIWVIALSLDAEILVLRWQHTDGGLHEGPIPLAWLRMRSKSFEEETIKARAMPFFKNVSIRSAPPPPKKKKKKKKEEEKKEKKKEEKKR